MRKPIYVTGHKNPDSDSICSAIAYSHLKNQLGMHTIPVRLGDLNNDGYISITDVNLLSSMIDRNEYIINNTMLIGDVDGNGFVDEIDIELIGDYIAGGGMSFCGYCKINADLNKDGRIGAIDSAWIKSIVHENSSFKKQY